MDNTTKLSRGRPRRVVTHVWGSERDWLKMHELSYQDVADVTGLKENRIHMMLNNKLQGHPDEIDRLKEYFQKQEVHCGARKGS
jgi:hypothetical protein